MSSETISWLKCTIDEKKDGVSRQQKWQINVRELDFFNMRENRLSEYVS